MSFHIANISSVFITFDKFELSYSFTFDKMSYLTEHRLQFISGISVTHCVKECAARTHCKALRFRNRINVCELFASSLQDLSLTTGSITLKEGEQNITKVPFLNLFLLFFSRVKQLFHLYSLLKVGYIHSEL
jgi:hypothetical protein